MATYPFNPATDHDKRKQYLNLLKKKARLIATHRKSGKAIDIDEYKRTLDMVKQLQRIDDSANSVLAFGYHYFSDECNPENDSNLIPSGFKIDDAPDFHIELTGMLDHVHATTTGSRIAWASPRGF